MLKDLPGLVHLNLRGQEVTDANSVHLKPLTSLTRLHLENTKITDKGVANLSGLVNLEYLNLYGTTITDAFSFIVSNSMFIPRRCIAIGFCA